MRSLKRSTRTARLRMGPRHIAGQSAWAVGAVFFVGCTLFPNEPNMLQIFDRTASADASTYEGPAVSWELAVSEFAAREPVAGVRIAVRNRDQSYGVLTGARWSLPAPRLVQAVLVEAFERSARVPGVGPSSMLRGQCQLNGELREFHWAPHLEQATLTMAVRLQCGASDAVQAMRTFTASQPVEGRGAASLVSAFDDALAELTPELVEWALANGPTEPRAIDPR